MSGNTLRKNSSITASPLEKSHRMQLVLSADAAASLNSLKSSNGCASYGETIRRAIDFLYRVVKAIGMPSSIDPQDQSVRLTDRVPVIINSHTLQRIEELCETEQTLNSKSEAVRVALELYNKASRAQRGMKEIIIDGPKGSIKSSLAFMP